MSEANRPNDDVRKHDASAGRPSGSLRWLKYLVVLVAGGLLLGLVVMGVADATYTARRVEFGDHLKQVGLAATNFDDVWGHFPPAIADGSEYREVTQPLSFHASIVPYIMASSLWGRMDKTIPWNAPANRDAYEVVWQVYLSPFYEVEKSPEGYGGTLIVPSSPLIPAGVGIAKDEIIDGTANTILAGGIDDAAVPAWGDPDNDRDPANGFADGTTAFGGLPKGGAQVLFADGHVEMMSGKASPEVARALATPAGGETTAPTDPCP